MSEENTGFLTDQEPKDQSQNERDQKELSQKELSQKELSQKDQEPDGQGDAPRSKLSQAVAVLQTATGEHTQEERVAIARKALEVSPECVEAWLLLAGNDAEHLDDARNYLQEAVNAGDRLFAGKREEWMGKFWEISRTRPYMQARSALGQVLWELKRYDEAVDVLEETLRLNRGDQQGIRHILLKALLDTSRYEDAAALTDAYEQEQSTLMLYGKLLTAFMIQGDSLMARSAFLAARRHNPFVLDYLLHLRTMPQKLPKQSDTGQESEAIRYCAAFGDAWESAEGALSYLRAQKKLRQDKEARRKR
ncbi:MAG: hypothetical protein ACYCVB_08550 [Bacilli bacterium]